jgi:hypothetical protein
MKAQFGMVLGEILFEESGNVTGFKVTKVHPMEGVTMEVSFTSEIKGIGRFPSGKNLGSGTVTQYPHGIVDGSYQGSFMINEVAVMTISYGGLMKRPEWLKTESSKG